MYKQNNDTVVIFRRYMTLRNGTVLDAHDYGHKAWRIVVKKQKHK